MIALPSIIISNPIPVELLCKFIENIITDDAKGIFHTAGPDSITRYEFRKLIGDIFGLDSNLVTVNNQNISPLRPKNLSLNTEQAFNLLKINPDEWRLKKYLSQFNLYE